MMKKMTKNKGLILLSGGLDSQVCLGAYKEVYGITQALFFNYGQLSKEKELKAVKSLCKFYKIKLKIINLPWLKNLSKSSSLTSKITNQINKNDNVWVPNRNGLFVNIAGCFAEELGFSHIIIGANCEEAKEFPDNSENFIKSLNNEFKYSTKCDIKIVAPLIDLDKNEIVKLAIENNVPLEYVWSCYSKNDKHCGVCKSCIGLKNALRYNKNSYYLKLLFEDEN